MVMALINFNTLLDHLRSPHCLLNEMLTSQEGLHFGDIRFALPWPALNMQCISLRYLKSLISDNCFQPEGMPSDAVSGSTAILIIFLSDEQHTAMIYSDDIAIKNQNHFNTMASPPGLCTHSCICRALLWHADLTETHKQKYNGSCLIVPHGTQYKTLFPEITMLHNHRGPLINQSSGKPYPIVPVGDFSLVDKMFPCSPADSLLFNGEELARLKRKGYQISTFLEEKLHPSSPKRKEQLSSHSSGDMLGSSSRKVEPPKTSSKSPGASSPRAPPNSTSSKKSSSSHSKSSPQVKE